MTIELSNISIQQAKRILTSAESHFLDVKSRDSSPSKLTKHLSAFANADGGELFVGIEDNPRKWLGFSNEESANSLIQVIESLFAIGDAVSCTFLKCDRHLGLVLHIQIQKTRDIKSSSDGTIYIRRGAQSLPVSSPEAIDRLKKDKGLVSYEGETLNLPIEYISNTNVIIPFLIDVIPTAEPEPWLRKQLLIINDKPTVAGVLLFSEEPQAALPKRCGIKIYRYKTTSDIGTRETLDFDPLTIEGSLYDQIYQAVEQTTSIVESVRILTPDGFEAVKYPKEALHEIVTNAVLHRDYSITDDVHIRVFDNRVEVQSPGRLPGHITPENILDERFSRNPSIVRLLNKFPNAPNKDVGEGLNTAFETMRNMRLKPPIIEQREANVLIKIRHEPLASPEELIIQFLGNNSQIVNKRARELCHIGSENKMKLILQKMVAAGLIELVPGTTRYNAAYQLKV